jgi:hypothetical protein
MVDHDGKSLLCTACKKPFYPANIKENDVFYTYCLACNTVISSFLAHPIETNEIVKAINRKLGLTPD